MEIFILLFYCICIEGPRLPLWLSWQRIHLQCGRPGFNPWGGKISWGKERLPTPYCGLENSMGSQRVRQDWTTYTLTQKICHFNHFQVKHPAAFCAFTLLYNHHCCSTSEVTDPKWKCTHLSGKSSFPPPHSLWQLLSPPALLRYNCDEIVSF